MTLELFVTSGACIPCRTLEHLIAKQEWDDKVNILVDCKRPLVYDVPTLIVNGGQSVYRGVQAITHALCLALPRNVYDDQEDPS